MGRASEPSSAAGTASGFERCEACNTTVMCRDCLDYCKKCGGPICHYCVEEGHVEQSSDN